MVLSYVPFFCVFSFSFSTEWLCLTEHYICIIYYLMMTFWLFIFHILCDVYIYRLHIVSCISLRANFRLKNEQQKKESNQPNKSLSLSRLGYYFIIWKMNDKECPKSHEHDNCYWLSRGCWNVIKLFSWLIYYECSCASSFSLISFSFVCYRYLRYFHGIIVVLCSLSKMFEFPLHFALLPVSVTRIKPLQKPHTNTLHTKTWKIVFLFFLLFQI